MLIGVIAEYNPFHNGHAYQIEYLREHYAPEGIFVVMSGNFVQRGEPAAFDKYARAEAALLSGADMVFELPQIYAVSSAQGFAAAGVRLLAAAGCDAIACGAEDLGFDAIDKIVEILDTEPTQFRSELRENLKSGMTYPAARAAAVNSLLPGADAGDFLSKPNNLLALEYHLAAKKYVPGMKVIMHERKNAGHDDDHATGRFASASYIRSLLRSGGSDKLNELLRLVPESAGSLYRPSDFLQWKDFDEVLFEKLIDFAEKAKDDDRPLANRIKNNLTSYRGAEDFIELLKTKNLTYTAASRMLVQILLGYDMADFDADIPEPSYIRLLGRKKTAAPLLSHISSAAKNVGSEIITSLPDNPAPLLARNIKNDMLYEGIRAMKSGTPIQSEYQRRFLVR